MQRNEDKFQHWKKLLDPLFGEIDDMDASEAEQILESAGIDYEAVKRRTYDKLSASAASLRLKGKSVSADLQEALEAFRPLDAPPRTDEEAKRQAHGMLGRFLGKQAGVLGSLRFAFSYRNRGELTPEDVRLLDSMVEKLKGKLGREE
jgi:hypothetical protein